MVLEEVEEYRRQDLSINVIWFVYIIYTRSHDVHDVPYTIRTEHFLLFEISLNMSEYLVKSTSQDIIR